MPLIHPFIEHGKALGLLLKHYMRDTDFVRDWEELKSNFQGAIVDVATAVERAANTAPQGQLELLLRERYYAVVHGRLSDARVADSRLASELMNLESRIEGGLVAGDQVLLSSGLAEAITALGAQWGLDCVGMGEILIVVGYLQLTGKSIRVDEELFDFLLPDAFPNLTQKQIHWSQPETKDNRINTFAERYDRWSDELQRVGLHEETRHLDTYMYWLYLADGKHITSRQICLGQNYNPLGVGEKRIQNVTNEWRKRLGKLTPARRGRPKRA